MKTSNELILKWLKNEYEINKLNLQTKEGENLWIMAVSIIQLKPCESHATLSPSHKVRLVLRHSDSAGTCDYVDGTDILMLVNEDDQTVLTEQWADDWQYGPPLLEGSPIPTALNWVTELAIPFHIQVADPFLTPTQRLLLNGHNEDYRY